MTESESKLWQHLRLKQMGGHRFRRQHPLGVYIVDFACLEKKLVIEVDGGHHSDQAIKDQERTTWLKKEGYTVLRFWNNEIMSDIDAVKQKIWNTIEK